MEVWSCVWNHKADRYFPLVKSWKLSKQKHQIGVYCIKLLTVEKTSLQEELFDSEAFTITLDVPGLSLTPLGSIMPPPNCLPEPKEMYQRWNHPEIKLDAFSPGLEGTLPRGDPAAEVLWVGWRWRTLFPGPIATTQYLTRPLKLWTGLRIYPSDSFQT